MKSKIILQPNEFSSFTSYYLEPLWRQFFDIEIYDPNKTYDKKNLFVFWWGTKNHQCRDQLYKNGNKVVIDNLWEIPNNQFSHFYQLTNPDWFWINESLWWQSLGYDQYRPKKNYNKKALMPIRRISAIRDSIVHTLGPRLNDMIWSYRTQRLPNDRFIDNNDVDQRFFNTEWYDNTCFNLVVESQQHGTLFLLTDKTYKACAFYQPMLIIGQCHSLDFLKTQGFETFENIFNESYDQTQSWEQRMIKITDNIDSFVQEPYSSLTWDKCLHNHHHFFNKSRCEQKIMTEIIEPLLQYAET